MSSLIADLRYALRMFRSAPAVTATVLLTLALGIGAASAIFSVVNGVLLQPLAYDEPQELVLVATQFPTMGFDRFWMSPPEYMELEEWNDSFEGIAGYRDGDASIVGTDQPIRVRCLYATASLLPLLGVEPILGRGFTEAEDTPDAEGVVLLSHDLWRRTFGGRSNVLGERLDIDGTPATVIGVMPPGFDIEESGAEVLLPVGLDRSNRENRGSHFLNVVARLKQDRTLESARSELTALVAGWKERSGAGHVPSTEAHPMLLLPLREEVVGESRPALLALLGAVGFVLLIACANVANLLLSRSEARQREMAVRSAMGATRSRLIRQVLTESVLLSAVGGALGLVVAHWGLRALLASNPEALPRASEVGLDPRVLLFAITIAVVTGILFGMAPALQVAGRRFAESLKEGGLRTTMSGAGKRLRQGLVAVEIALAVALVIGAGLMIKSLGSMLQVDPGFEVERLTTFEIRLPETGYPDGESQAAFLTRLTDSIRELPGTLEVSATSDLPPQTTLDANDTEFEGLERTEDGPPHNIDYWEIVTNDYFEAMQARVLEGRAFSASDDAQATPVVLINQKTADTFWPGENALGRRIRPGFGDDVPWFTIIGIVGDIKQNGLDNEVGTHVFWKYEQLSAAGFAPRRMYVVVRSSQPDDSLLTTLRDKVWALDPALPVARMRTMEEVINTSAARRRLLAVLLGLFGGAALFLAAIGIYGVLSYSVSQRSQEIGVRMALGADRGNVLSLILGQGVWLAAVGVALGVALAFALSRFVRSLLFGVEATDPSTYILVAAFLTAIALLACLIPALRATRVNPLTALRHD
jgi:predicted permease